MTALGGQFEKKSNFIGIAEKFRYAFTNKVHSAPGRGYDMKTLSEKAQKTREAILSAARKIVREEGVRALTLDRVVEVGHFSKGAVTYHFKNRKALNMALLQSFVDFMQADLTKHERKFGELSAETLLPGGAEWFRSFEKSDYSWAKFGIHMLSVLSPDLISENPVRSWYRKMAERGSELPEDQEVKLLTGLLAMEGLFLSTRLGLNALPAEKKEAVMDFICTELSPGKPEAKTES